MFRLSLTVLAITAASIACGCDGDNDDRMDNRSGSSTRDNSGSVLNTTDADRRILSIMHAKNLQEMDAGRLAQERGGSEAVRNYGRMLYQDHSANDTRVQSAAQSAGVSLMSPSETMDMMHREKGDMAGRYADPLAQLRNLQGADFDREFVRMMRDGHEDLIRTLEAARPNLRHRDVRNLVANTLPELREHSREVSQIAIGQ